MEVSQQVKRFVLSIIVGTADSDEPEQVAALRALSEAAEPGAR